MCVMTKHKNNDLILSMIHGAARPVLVPLGGVSSDKARYKLGLGVMRSAAVRLGEASRGWARQDKAWFKRDKVGLGVV